MDDDPVAEIARLLDVSPSEVQSELDRSSLEAKWDLSHSAPWSHPESNPLRDIQETWQKSRQGYRDSTT